MSTNLWRRFSKAVALTTLLGVSAVVQTPARAQEPDHELLRALADDMQQLKVQQRQILDQLGEIKRLTMGVTVDVAAAGPPIKAAASINVEGASFRGSPSARVVVIEYADYRCPFCREFEQSTYPRLRQAYVDSGAVRLYFRDFPLRSHVNAMPAAQAAHCADEQGKFWEMHDSLFSPRATLSPGDLHERAGKLGLDLGSFDECLKSGRYVRSITESMEAAKAIGIHGTPTFLIGTLTATSGQFQLSRSISGARPFETFKVVIDGLLAGAGSTD
jgi:protein-disulfide isomerase